MASGGLQLYKIDKELHSIIVDDGGGSITVDGTVTVNVNFSYPEDSAHVSGDNGVMALAVRTDVKASTAGADGDYAALIQDADGDLYVSDTVAQGYLSTLAGTVSDGKVQVDVSSLPNQYQEDAIASGEEFGPYVLGMRRDADTSPVSADGDYHGLIFNSSGRLKVDNDESCNDNLVVSKVSIPATAGGTQLVASALANRKEIHIANLGPKDIFIKKGTGVTVDDYLIPAFNTGIYAWGPTIDVYGITAVGSSDIRIAQVA